jgi:tetratricopeptide (TPR) repeat protein
MRSLTCVFVMSSMALLAPRAAAQDSGAVALAERYAQLARDVLSVKSVGKPQLDISTALLEAAVREDPGEPRLQKLLIEAYLETGNSDGALKAISDYRKLQPGDRVAQIQLIDIYLSRMESADQRQKYLLDLLGRDGVPSEVRAHCGVKGAKVLLDRGDDAQAKQVLEQALGLNPLDGEGLQLRYELARNSTSTERTHALFALLRANPSQPAVMARIAAEFASAGLPEMSIQWYDRSMALAQRMGLGLDANDFLQKAIEQLVNNQPKLADPSVAPLVQGDPTNLPGVTVRLLAARAVGDKDAQARWIAQAFELLANRINAIDAAINGKPASTTKPSTNPAERLPDLVAGAKAVMQKGDQNLQGALAQALIDFAWLEIYYNEKPALAAQSIEALKLLLTKESPIVPRLEGWAFLVQKRNDEAKVKLSAVAAKDPLSQAGLLLLAPSEQKDQATAATKLLQENAGDLEGAVLLDALRPLGVKLSPGPDAAALNSELQKFPMDWLNILDRPKDFYSIKAEPLKVSHLFGEPMLMRVTLQNASKYDLSLGAQGVIRPDLWFDANCRGVAQGDFKGVAYERLGQQYVLKQNEQVSLVTRVDRGQLHAMLMSNPVAALSIYFSVFTNPVQGGQSITFGPAGFREQAKSVVERAPSPITSPEQQAALQRQLASPDGSVRICTAELFATYASLLKGQANATEAQKSAAQKLIDTIDPLTTDPSTPVRVWASYLMSTLVPADKRPERVSRMLADPQWEMRVSGLGAATILPPEQMNKLIEPVAKDSDPIVSKLAQALVARAKAAATQPSGTQPAAQQPSASQPTTAAAPAIQPAP